MLTIKSENSPKRPLPFGTSYVSGSRLLRE
jgi:hypothetical protein